MVLGMKNKGYKGLNKNLSKKGLVAEDLCKCCENSDVEEGTNTSYTSSKWDQYVMN